MLGAQYVMTSGVQLMLKWPADSWDFQLLVSDYHYVAEVSLAGILLVLYL